MIPIQAQLSFLKSLHSAMLRSDLKRVANDEMTQDKAEERNEAMCSIISTLERQVMLWETSEEIKAQLTKLVGT